MITAPELEIAVLVLGMAILMVESFATRIDRRFLAFAAIAGLAAVLVASFFVAPSGPPDQATGFWSFYTADRLAIFFKQFALLTTIVVLIMMIDYAPVVRDSFPGSTLQAGLGEFFAVPIFTCAGLMYMASAIDFIFIFVSLELVTISFYVLVSFTRRNPATLEAGVKYLVLSALSTAFFVYGITWLFGATGETNLQRITVALTNPSTEHGAALFGMVLVLVALGFKIAAVPFQIWVPDVYQGAPTPDRSRRAAHLDLRKPGRAAANQSKTAARLLEHRARRISAHRCGVLRRGRGDILPRSLSAHDTAEFRGPCHCSATNRRSDFRFRWIGHALALSRFRDVDRDGLARGCAIYRGIPGEVFYLLRCNCPAPDRAGRRRCNHGGLWVLLLSESGPRDVLAARCGDRQDSHERAVAHRDQRIDRCDDLAGHLSAADLRRVEALKHR